MKAHFEEEAITNINIAPLVDVILVLLIIFMATAPMIHQRSLNVNVPQAAHSEAKATTAVNLVYSQSREIFLGQEKLSIKDLKFQLGAMVKSDPLLHIAILADEAIPYGEVVELLDLVRGSGIKKVALEVKAKRAE